jgi:hypothetical protein
MFLHSNSKFAPMSPGGEVLGKPECDMDPVHRPAVRAGDTADSQKSIGQKG